MRDLAKDLQADLMDTCTQWLIICTHLSWDINEWTDLSHVRTPHHGHTCIRESKESNEITDALSVDSMIEPHQSPVYHPNTVSVSMQTDMTANDICALETDYQQRVKEISEIRGGKGYPDKESLKDNDKLLTLFAMAPWPIILFDLQRHLRWLHWSPGARIPFPQKFWQYE